MNKWDLFQVCKADSTLAYQCDLPYQQGLKKKSSNKMQHHSCKNSQQSRNRGKFPQVETKIYKNL